ncbi:hypothetical protein CSZ94_08030 [Janthinobacterium sp. ROICE36]|nr:hypothetical protein CSZ94_08030 [Janthinobacterium sp. ROICE36]
MNAGDAVKRSVLLLSFCLAFSSAQAASKCPGFPVLATSGEALQAQVRALPPIGIDRERQACAPATIIDFAYSGGTLCRFGAEVDAATAAVTRLADGGALVEYLYLFAHGGYYISLGKPTEGDPAEWYSNVMFEKMDKPAFGVRKVCQEGRDG